MSALVTAANIRAPHKLGESGVDKGANRAVQKQAVATASTAAVAVGFTAADQEVYYTFVCDQDCYICFGTSAVGAATSDEWPLKADQPQMFKLNRFDLYFRVIRKSADGTLKWYPSGWSE